MFASPSFALALFLAVAGSVSFAAAPAAAPDPSAVSAAQFIRALDTDRSGGLSRDEFLAVGSRTFAERDLNADGELSLDEATQANRKQAEAVQAARKRMTEAAEARKAARSAKPQKPATPPAGSRQ